MQSSGQTKKPPEGGFQSQLFRAAQYNDSTSGNLPRHLCEFLAGDFKSDSFHLSNVRFWVARCDLSLNIGSSPAPQFNGPLA